MRDQGGHYYLWSERFTSLNELVEFYKSTSISKTREIYLNDGTTSSPVAQSVRDGGGSLRPLDAAAVRRYPLPVCVCVCFLLTGQEGKSARAA